VILNVADEISRLRESVKSINEEIPKLYRFINDLIESNESLKRRVASLERTVAKDRDALIDYGILLEDRP